MFALAECVIGIGADTAQARLADLARDGSLTEIANAAYLSGVDYLRRSGRPGDLAGGQRLARVQVLKPRYRADLMTIGMRWELTDAAGAMFPVLDGDITVCAESPRRTRVSLTGCYRSPPGSLCAGRDKAILGSEADVTLQSAVSGLAVALEH
ncbi:MAG TPA: hypothetical protein VMC03_14655 [Streptosporangiaceae bacterium]|nr:hypothetical protein [Streptosporangiaceae bacterium]